MSALFHFVRDKARPLTLFFPVSPPRRYTKANKPDAAMQLYYSAIDMMSNADKPSMHFELVQVAFCELVRRGEFRDALLMMKDN